MLHHLLHTLTTTNTNAGTSVETPSLGAQSHRGQTAFLLPDDSTAAQEACNHHQASSQDEDICRDSKSAGGQQTQVVTLLHQCPDSNTQNSCSTHLEEKREVTVGKSTFILSVYYMSHKHETTAEGSGIIQGKKKREETESKREKWLGINIYKGCRNDHFLTNNPG